MHSNFLIYRILLSYFSAIPLSYHFMYLYIDFTIYFVIIIMIAKEISLDHSLSYASFKSYNRSFKTQSNNFCVVTGEFNMFILSITDIFELISTTIFLFSPYHKFSLFHSFTMTFGRFWLFILPASPLYRFR